MHRLTLATAKASVKLLVQHLAFLLFISKTIVSRTVCDQTNVLVVTILVFPVLGELAAL